MPRFVDAELAPTGECEARDQSPSCISDRTAANLSLFHRGNEGFDVIAHQVQLVNAVLAGMNGHFGGRQSEDEPALPGVDARERKDVSQKLPIGFRLPALDEGM